MGICWCVMTKEDGKFKTPKYVFCVCKIMMQVSELNTLRKITLIHSQNWPSVYHAKSRFVFKGGKTPIGLLLLQWSVLTSIISLPGKRTNKEGAWRGQFVCWKGRNLKGVSRKGSETVWRKVDDTKVGESRKLTKLQALNLGEVLEWPPVERFLFTTWFSWIFCWTR